MKRTPPEWPQSLKDIAQAAGAGAAEAVLRAWGGRRVYLRRQTLAPIVGDQAALAIIGAIGAGFFDVPKAAAEALRKRDAEICRRRADGETLPLLAGTFGLTKRRVMGILAAQRRTRLPPPATASKDTTEDRRMTTDTATPSKPLFALGNIQCGARTYRRGDRLPAEMTEAHAPELVAAGAASWDEPPPHKALLPLLRQAREARTEARYNGAPTLGDWLVLVEDTRLARGASELSEDDALRAAEHWECLSEVNRLRAYQSADASLLDYRRRMAASYFASI